MDFCLLLGHKKYFKGVKLGFDGHFSQLSNFSKIKQLMNCKSSFTVSNKGRLNVLCGEIKQKGISAEDTRLFRENAKLNKKGLYVFLNERISVQV